MPIQFSMDTQRYSSKPERSETVHIQSRIGQNVVSVELNQLPELITKVGEQGYTIAPGTFKNGKRNKDNFIQQQLFMLDFDNSDPKKGTITTDEFMERCNSLGIPVTATYETFSSTEDNPRFRAIFLNDAPITDKRLAEDMARMLGTIFPEADPCWKNCAAMYYGGKKVLYINDDLTNTINVPLLVEAHDRYIYLSDKSGKHYKEKLNRKWKNGKPHVASGDAIEKLPNAVVIEGNVKNGGKLPSSILLYTNIESGRIPPFYNIAYSSTQQRICEASIAPTEQNILQNSSKQRKTYRSDILKKLPSKCQLFNEFIHGLKELSHDELWSIATNLIQIESGRALFLETCAKFPELHTSDDPEFAWDRQLSYIKKKGYNPKRCNNFCPYKDLCSHGKNMLVSVVPKVMEEVEGYRLGLRSLDEVYEETKRAILKACDATDIRVYVINSMTAIGKTTILIQIVSKRSNERFLIAEPTLLMRDECYERFKKEGIKVMVTPSLDDLEDELSDELFKDLMKRRERGEATTPYISKILREMKCSKDDESVLKKFLSRKQALKKFEGTVITTHRYLEVCDDEWLDEFDNIIIDEDILYKTVATNHLEISMRKLKKIAAKKGDPALIEKVKQLKEALKNGLDYVKLDRIPCNDDESSPLSLKLKALYDAEHFYVRSPADEPNLKEETVSFVVPVQLPENRKLIVVSATANEEVYERYFGTERVKFKMCDRAPYEGTLQQYYGLSMSRACLENHPGIITFIQRHFSIPDSNVLTYKKESTGEFHFGNLEGSNMLEGEDILVVGSAYQPPFIYVLAAAALGFEIDDTTMRKQRVEHNGYRFSYYAFDDPDLRTVQFWMTESELEQAVGRARLLRHNCTVYLFSNFPCQQAQMIDGYTVYGSFIKSMSSAANETSKKHLMHSKSVKSITPEQIDVSSCSDATPA